MASLASAVFVTMRAVQVPLTYDEAAAYLRYVAAEPLAVFDFSVATNHLLNTLLTKLCAAAAGNSELVLRVPSLVGYLLYVCFSVLILRELRRRVLAFAWFLVLNLNPYVLEYFALSRGYGLSVGLMMGALFFLFGFLGHPDGGPPARRHLSRSVLFAAAAVMANFAMLNVYLALLTAVILGSAISMRAGDRRQPSPTQWPGPGRLGMLLLIAGTAAYTALVFSQDVGLSPGLYEPVTVRIAASEESVLEQVRVFRIDHRGRREPLRRSPEGWRLDRTAAFIGIRVEIPRETADALRSIEVVVGASIFSYERAVQALWTATDTADVRALESNPSLSLTRSNAAAFRPAINWKGDRNLAIRLAAHAGLAALIVGAGALLLAGVGWLFMRARLVTPGVWRTICMSLLWMFALVGPPLYLLKRNGELYYGGITGLVADTFYSSIQGSFYGRTYDESQVTLTFTGILVSMGILGVVLAVRRRSATSSPIPAALSLLTILIVVSVGIAAQRLLFGTPYLLGRTALFYIPLYVTFLALATDTLAGWHRIGRLAASAFTTLVLSVSVYHFAETANLKHSIDWPQDASTKLMIADLAEIVAAERPAASRVSLGVDWMYYPVAVYYAQRSAAPIEIQVLPGSGRLDYAYVEDVRGAPAGQVLRRYARTGSTLLRLSGG